MLDKLDATQLRNLLTACPIGMMMLDAQGTVTWVNPILLSTLDLDEGSVLGKSESTVDPLLRTLFQNEAIFHSADESVVLAVSSQKIDSGRMQYIMDISTLRRLVRERDDLRQKVRDLTLSDDITGMMNKRGLLHALEPQVARSRRYGNLLSVLLIRVDNYQDLLREHGKQNMDKVLLSITHLLNEIIRWVDTIGRFGDDEFMVILPETTIDQALQLISKLRENFVSIRAEGIEGNIAMNAHFGAVQWQKGEDLRLLLQHLRESLQDSEELCVAVQA